MNHALLKSRERGFTDEGINLNWLIWLYDQIVWQYPNDRIVKAHQRDGARKLGIMGRYTTSPRISSIKGAADVLLRWSAMPGTSSYFAGGCHAGKEEHERIYRGEKTRDFIAYHLEVLDALGTLVYHPNFAYAPDLESFGDYDLESKKAVQAEFVSVVRRKYPDLAIILTTGGYGNPSDVLEYGEMPAEGCLLRMCFYDPFPFTHSYVRGLRAYLPYPATTSDVQRSLSPDMPEWAVKELEAAIGYGKAQMRSVLEKVDGTGLPVLIQEAGVGRMSQAVIPSAARWHADLRSVCWSLGLPLMEFSAGIRGGSGNWFHLGVGLDAIEDAGGRKVAGL